MNERIRKLADEAFKGFKHRKISCIHCLKEISANNYPQHIRKYHNNIDSV
jgi:hypothetical protein